MLWNILEILSWIPGVFAIYAWGCMLVQRNHDKIIPDGIKAVFFVLRDLYWIGAVADWIHTLEKHGYGWLVFNVVVYTLVWVLYKDTFDDDDRKKLKEKVISKVKSLGHRLTVVPSNA